MHLMILCSNFHFEVLQFCLFKEIWYPWGVYKDLYRAWQEQAATINCDVKKKESCWHHTCVCDVTWDWCLGHVICEFYADSWSVGYIILFYFLILNSQSLSLVSTFPLSVNKNSPRNESVMETDWLVGTKPVCWYFYWDLGCGTNYLVPNLYMTKFGRKKSTVTKVNVPAHNNCNCSSLLVMLCAQFSATHFVHTHIEEELLL